MARARESMSARARRHWALEDAKYHLNLWRDHGSLAELETAIEKLRRVS